MATLDLWMEGDWGGGEENIVWHEVDVPFNLQRYHYDQRYAEVINKYVKDKLENLAKELAEIALLTPDEIDEWANCE